MSRHELKTDSDPFTQVWYGNKTAEFRKNDRLFQYNDQLILTEWKDGEPTGRTIWASVSHIQEGYGIPDGYAMLSLDPESVVRFDGLKYHGRP